MLMGVSTRIKDKPFVKIDGKELFLHGYATLRKIFDSIIIVYEKNKILKNKLKKYPIKKIPENHEIGPLGGIYEGMKHCTGEYVFVNACDMPFLNPDVIKFLYKNTKKDGIVPRHKNGQIEPLHAFYRREKILKIFNKIKGRSIKDMLALLDIHYISTEKLRNLDPELLTFRNLNTREDILEFHKTKK